jgi:hypothetical protein
MTAPVEVWSKRPHPGYFINSVAISADGSRVVAGTFYHDYSASADASLARRADAGIASGRQSTFGTYVWDSAGSELMAKTFDGWQGVYWVDLSADGATAASSGWMSNDPYAGFIAAYDVDTAGELLMYQPKKRGNMVRLNADGTVLVAGADSGYLFVRAPGASFSSTPTVIALSDPSDQVLVATVDASGGTGLIASYHGEVIVFTQSGGLISALQRWQLPNSAYLHAGALAADASYAYVGANTGILYALRVADFLSDGSIAWTTPLPGGATTIYGVATSADGSIVGVGGNLESGGIVAVYGNKYDNAALLWQSTTPEAPNGLSMDASGTYLGAADGHSSGGDFTLWQPLVNQMLWTYSTSEMCWPIAIAANASYVAAGSDDGKVYLFEGPVGA